MHTILSETTDYDLLRAHHHNALRFTSFLNVCKQYAECRVIDTTTTATATRTVMMLIEDMKLVSRQTGPMMSPEYLQYFDTFIPTEIPPPIHNSYPNIPITFNAVLNHVTKSKCGNHFVFQNQSVSGRFVYVACRVAALHWVDGVDYTMWLDDGTAVVQHGPYPTACCFGPKPVVGSLCHFIFDVAAEEGTPYPVPSFSRLAMVRDVEGGKEVSCEEWYTFLSKHYKLASTYCDDAACWSEEDDDDEEEDIEDISDF